MVLGERDAVPNWPGVSAFDARTGGVRNVPTARPWLSFFFFTIIILIWTLNKYVFTPPTFDTDRWFDLFFHTCLLGNRSLFTSVADMASIQNGDFPQAAASKSKKMGVEEIYQKKSQLEHILLRPDTYIGKNYSYYSVVAFIQFSLTYTPIVNYRLSRTCHWIYVGLWHWTMCHGSERNNLCTRTV